MMMSHIHLVVFAYILQGTPAAKPDGKALSSGQEASIKIPLPPESLTGGALP
jgi:hypothetical protein